MSQREENDQVRGRELGWGQPASLWLLNIMVVGTKLLRETLDAAHGTEPMCIPGSILNLIIFTTPVLGSRAYGLSHPLCN